MKRTASTMLTGLLIMVAAFVILPDNWVSAQTYSMLYSFTGGTDQGFPAGGLIFGSQGNLYGVTEGTQNNFGTVFEMPPPSGGSRSVTTLYTFQNFADGYYPVSKLVFDKNGNLYGTTAFGGTGTVVNCTNRCGTVFELSPNGAGGWTKTEIYQFQGGADGATPTAGMVIDSSGNLYGTTSFGGGNCGSFGQQGCGTVFELSPGASGWTETILHRFGVGNCPQCVIAPQAGLVADAKGNLYGAATVAGPGGCGGVFELTRGTNAFKLLHTFNCGSDGGQPYSTLKFDTSARLYGTTLNGGNYNKGVVFVLRQATSGAWVNRVIHHFDGTDGAAPFVDVTLDAASNVYGTTTYGGGSTNCTSGCGVAYKLTKVSSTSWTYSMLHAFTGNGSDGQYPNALLLDGAGNLFGTTNQGGAYSLGTVFEIAP